MKKINIPRTLLIPIIILLITFFVSIYTLYTSNYVVSTNTLLGILIGLLLFTVIGIFVIIKIHNKKEIKPEKALLFILPIFCILVSATIPMGKAHDETMHWYKAFEISRGQFMTPIDEEEKISVAILPEGVQNISVERSKGVFKYVDYLSLLDEKIDYSKEVGIANQNSAAYCFIQYIPEVIGILIGQILTQTPILIAYFVRFVNMIICTVIMYFAIKKIPFGKNILLVLSIIPIAIEGFGTISPDGLTLAICSLFISYTLYIAFDKNKMCGTRETTILTIIGIIVSLCKIVYMPLIFLCLIIPKEKFKDKKERISSLATIISLGVIVNLIWLVFGSLTLLYTNTNTYLGTQQSGTMIKVMAILSNPIGYIQKLFYTIGIKSNQYFLSLFGGQLEWNETIKLNIIPYVLCAISLIASFTDENLKIAFKKYQKMIILLIIVVISLLIFTSLFIQWSSNDLLYIDGVQGRYFLPILPLALFLIAGLKIKTNYTNSDITKLICISGIIVQLYTITMILADHL